MSNCSTYDFERCGNRHTNLCNTCIRQFKDHFTQFQPVCMFRHLDCKHDPARIFYKHTQWYMDTFNKLPPEYTYSNTPCSECNMGSNYEMVTNTKEVSE